jgi:hypothetical protein
MYNADMETITRHVRDIDAADRQALEHVIGRELSEDQEVIFQVVPFIDQSTENHGQESPAPGQLPPGAMYSTAFLMKRSRQWMR